MSRDTLIWQNWWSERILGMVRHRFDGRAFPTRGQNEEQRKQFARSDSGRMMAGDAESLENTLEQRRQKYDADTDFGHNPKRQSEYDAVFAGLRNPMTGTIPYMPSE